MLRPNKQKQQGKNNQTSQGKTRTGEHIRVTNQCCGKGINRNKSKIKACYHKST